ncbi:hypothetical protein [Clostridium weizhouense]|uniref:Flavodoxin domain-containing protein n=1 Tax=Clostridium weizhouense TaxID=2859781 RepID=A0ABS7ALX2_9CLOT|nr:hypothetical protein [Clostridium weizhouense]MBW6409660.1 hypothetical protein [Clostridium weizhouense]
MIYYFSGTGNSKWVAKQVGDKLNYEVINIIDINRNEKKLVRKGEVVGFIFPIIDISNMLEYNYFIDNEYQYLKL